MHAALMSMSDDGEAEKHLRNAIELYERAEHPLDAAVTYGHLGDLRARDDLAAAVEAYRSAVRILERVNT